MKGLFSQKGQLFVENSKVECRWWGISEIAIFESYLHYLFGTGWLWEKSLIYLEPQFFHP